MADYGSAQGDADAMLELLRDGAATVYPASGGGPTTVPVGATPPYISVHFVTENINGRRLETRSTRTLRVRKDDADTHHTRSTRTVRVGAAESAMPPGASGEGTWGGAE